MERLYWTDRDSFPLEEELGPLFEEALRREYRPYADVIDGQVALGGAFGIEGRHREAFYIRRGRGRRELRGSLWEVLLYEAETVHRLGPYFEQPEHTCVVVCGAEAVGCVNNCWLDGGEIADVIHSASFYNRSNMEALTPPDSSLAK